MLYKTWYCMQLEYTLMFVSIIRMIESNMVSTYKGLSALLKRNVFKRFLNTEMFSQFLTSSGREFHNCGAACAKARSPRVSQFVFGFYNIP
jgi:hypothetical protein